MAYAAEVLSISEVLQSEIKPLVSVIVPVYNVEPYLRRCIDSLIHQTLQGIEIILIDDGSTDGCGKICDEYVAIDHRIRVIHQNNAGLSRARNVGIDHAKADYLMFVDSDDWVEPEFCRLPFTLAIVNQAALVMFRFRNVNGRKRKRCDNTPDGLKNQEEAFNLIMNDVGMNAVNKLYHRSLFLVNRYPNGKVYEDVALTPVLVHEAPRIYYTSAVLYNRERRKNSITSNLSKQNAQDWMDAVTLTSNHLKEWRFVAEAKLYYQIYLLGFVAKGWKNQALNDECIRYFRELKQCPKGFSFKCKCKYYVLIISPKVYRFIYWVIGIIGC